MKLDDGKNFVPAQGVVMIPASGVTVDDVIAHIDDQGSHEGRVKSIEKLKDLPYIHVHLYQWADEISEYMEMKADTDSCFLNLVSLRIADSIAGVHREAEQVRWLGRWEASRSALHVIKSTLAR